MRTTKKMNQKTKGFTIIELIVVIAIIAVLSSIIIANVNQYTAKARDAKRLGDKNAVIKALTLYASDNGGDFPDYGNSLTCLGPNGSTCWGNQSGSDFLVSDLRPYLATMPTNNAAIGTLGYNRMLYGDKDATCSTACGNQPSVQKGPFVVWMQETKAPDCRLLREPTTTDPYWYCFEQIKP